MLDDNRKFPTQGDRGVDRIRGKDLSHPTVLSVEILEEIMAVQPKEWTILVFPNANHDFVENGDICQEDGPFTDAIPPLRDWFDRILVW